MKTFIMLIGLQGSGKSTIANQILNENPEYVYINLDAIHKEINGDFAYGGNDSRDKNEAMKRMSNAIKNNKSVLYDAVNAKYNKRQHFISMFKKKGYKIKFIYLNLHLAECFQNNIKRQNMNGHFVSFKSIQQMYIWSNFPLISEADEIEVITNEKINNEASEIFKSSIVELKNNAYIWALKYMSFIVKFIPELSQTIYFEQYNRHTLDLFSHLLKTTYNMSKQTDNELLIVAALLHDIGKIHTQKFLTRYNEQTYQVINIKECFIEKTTETVVMHLFNGNKKDAIEVDINQLPHIHGTYFGHENVSSRLAYDICIRLGYSEEQSLYISNIIQLHMDIPIESEDSKDKKILQKWKTYYQKCKLFHKELKLLRVSDANGK